MKTLIASLMLLNIGCTNANTVSVNHKPYDLPMAELPIELHNTVPSKVYDNIKWDQLSSDFYSEGEV